MQPQPLPWRWSPIEALERWPRSIPIAALVSGAGDPAGRWSILGVPTRWLEIPHGLPRDASIAALRGLADGPGAPGSPRRGMLRASTAAERRADAPPFRGGWIGFIAYEFGAVAEPTALPRGERDPDFPLAGGWRCDAAAVHDARVDRWWWCDARSSDRGGRGGTAPPELEPPAAADASLDPIRAERRPGDFEAMVARAIELIRAGDLYQANVSQRFESRRRGPDPLASRRAVAVAALAASRARYGAVVECPGDRAVVSMSPELFLERTGDRVMTRPIKGTRAGGADRLELFEDSKERAELAMIVDLMRNDLSRVCRPGSVVVRDGRRIEGHCGVEHALAEIGGRLADGARTSDLLLAAFPPGSVTGAPKIRAMQVIESLERGARGPYCGAVGILGDDGDCRLNVAIRTLCLVGDRVRSSTGCGIVADSDPGAEARESLVKLEPFRRTAERLTPRGAAGADAATRSPAGSAPPRSSAPVGGS